MAELGLAEEWIGSYNRESQTPPVLELRESAMRLGLLYAGLLLLLLAAVAGQIEGNPHEYAAGMLWRGLGQE